VSPSTARGAASVEHAALALLIALLLLAGISVLAADPPLGEGRELGHAIARKLRCAPRLPGPCWRDPLTEAYGRPLAGLVRASAPSPRAVAGPDGLALVPVDFRACRSAGCAAGADGAALTASNRRTTAFTSVVDRRRAGGGVAVSYWLYRPTMAWERVVRRASASDVAAAATTPLLESQVPVLVPLETLAGRNHFDFPSLERPPWQWQVPSVEPG
jgi:hypothetical protein